MIPPIDGKYTDYTLDMQPFSCKVAGNHHSLRDGQVICRSRQQVGTAGRCGHLPSGAMMKKGGGREIPYGQRLSGCDIRTGGV